MSNNCVLKGTLITLENNITKKIENLKVGERCLSYSIENIENTQNKTILGITKVDEFEGQFSYQLIKNIWKNEFKKYIKINKKLGITEDHFVICKRHITDKYFWIKVEDLRIGDELFKSDGLFELINHIEIIYEDNVVYNIQVNSIYTYFANGYLVHNGGTPCDGSYCGSYCGAAAKKK